MSGGAHERLVVANDRQADGLQAALRRVKDLAATQRYKSLAVSDFKTASRSSKCRQTTPPDRLVTQIPHSSGLVDVSSLAEAKTVGKQVAKEPISA
jgi:hypothetical protein